MALEFSIPSFRIAALTSAFGFSCRKTGLGRTSSCKRMKPTSTLNLRDLFIFIDIDGGIVTNDFGFYLELRLYDIQAVLFKRSGRRMCEENETQPEGR